MFEPKTFWEKRVAAMELVLTQVVNGIGAGGLLGGFYKQLEVLKSARAEELLGPVTIDPEDRATIEFVVETLMAELKPRGMVPFMLKKPDGQPATAVEYARDKAILQSRLGQLLDIDEKAGPAVIADLYRINAGEEFFPALSFTLRGQLYVFVLDEQSMQFYQLSLEHMPEGFQWGGEANIQRFWRSELFVYREDLTKAEFQQALAEALARYDALPKAELSEEELRKFPEYDAAVRAAEQAASQGSVVETVATAPANNDAMTDG